MRKFALASSAFKRYKLPEAIRHVALAGYAGIEILADAPHAYPPHVRPEDRKGIRSALAQNRLAISNINAAPMTALRDEVRPSWIEADRVLRLERVHHTIDAGKLAKDLGGPSISTLGGGPVEDIAHGDRAAAVARFADGLQQVVALVAKGKCTPLLIDPRKGLLVESAEQAAEIVEAVGSKHLGVSFNTAHFHLAGLDVPGSIRALGPLIRHVHVEDVAAGAAGTVVPGTGAVDFAAVFAALDEIGYKGWLTADLSGADVHPDEAARQTLKFLGRFDA